MSKMAVISSEKCFAQPMMNLVRFRIVRHANFGKFYV